MLAALLGVVTPFCSCSAVPMFIGFVSAGVPLGVTFSFLIAAPMVNEIALGLLFALVGWKVALLYLGVGLGIAIAAGWVIGRLHLEHWLEAWVRDLRSGAAELPPAGLTVADRVRAGLDAMRDIVGRVWPWMLAGIAVGACIHGFVPTDALAVMMGADSWWSVPAAVAIGIPMYSNAAGIVPVAEALLGKGAALGTVLAFMMAVIALSLPEMIILRKVMTLRLIARVRRRGRHRHRRRGISVQRAAPVTRRPEMKDVKVLGSGCKRCEQAAAMITAEAARLGVEIRLEKVTDYAAIAAYGIVSTPGIVVDGRVVHAGGLPKSDAIAGWLG